MSIEAVFPNAAQIDTQNAILARMAEKMGAFEKPTSFKGIQTFLRNGLIRHVLDESDQIQAALNINVTTEIHGTGVTAATVDKDTFLTTVGSHTHIHEFTYDGAAWLNNGEVVELKDYGKETRIFTAVITVKDRGGDTLAQTELQVKQLNKPADTPQG